MSDVVIYSFEGPGVKNIEEVFSNRGNCQADLFYLILVDAPSPACWWSQPNRKEKASYVLT